MNAGSINDMAGIAAVLALPATGTDGLAKQQIAIDAVTADQTLLGPGNNTTAGFTIHGGVAGEGYSYTATSSGGGSVSNSGTLTSASEDITPIDVSGLSKGTLTYNVTLANNPGLSLTATASLDIAPSGYTITPDQNLYNVVTGQSAGFTIANASAYIGGSVTYLVAGQTGGSSEGTVPLTSSPQDITGIDIHNFSASSGLSDSSVLFDITLTDAGQL